MLAIGLRRGLVGFALALTAVAALAPFAPVDARSSLGPVGSTEGFKIVFTTPITVDVAPPGYLLGQ